MPGSPSYQSLGLAQYIYTNKYHEIQPLLEFNPGINIWNKLVSVRERQALYCHARSTGGLLQEVLQVFAGDWWEQAIWSQTSRLAGNQSNRWGDWGSIFCLYICYTCCVLDHSHRSPNLHNHTHKAVSLWIAAPTLILALLSIHFCCLW